MNFAEAATQLAQKLRQGEMDDSPPILLGGAVQVLIDSTVASPSSSANTNVQRACKILNSNRHFAHTQMLGTAWTRRNGFDPTIDRHLAQALINLSALDEADKILESGLEKAQSASASEQMLKELPEYEGLRGRILKQRFVQTNDRDFLRRASEQYLSQYLRPDHPYWHGINAVALLAREERMGLKKAGDSQSSKALAAKLFEDVALSYSQTADSLKEGDRKENPWKLATLSEASLALGECEKAELWLYRFLLDPETKPFAVDSYQRQLYEIWQGDPLGRDGNCASRLSMLITQHLLRTQSRWSVLPSQAEAIRKADAGQLEKNFSSSTGFTVAKIKRMLEVCASIGCVSNDVGARLGTGFLVKGSAIAQTFGESPVFVTNAHVVSTGVPPAVEPDDARISFELNPSGGSSQEYRVEKVLFTSPAGAMGACKNGTDELDVSILRLKDLPPNFAALDISKELPLVDASTNAYVVGHPGGGGLQVSLHDSQLLDIDSYQRLVHYRTPTEPGNSGSPVFNTNWKVIALHHGGSPTMPRMNGKAGTYEANEGIALGAIMKCANSG